MAENLENNGCSQRDNAEHEGYVGNPLGQEKSFVATAVILAQKSVNETIVKNRSGKMIKYKLNRRPSQSKDNSVRSKAQIKRREREKSSVRSKVEHVFGVVKGLLRYRKPGTKVCENRPLN